jgi:hypothetical protein
MILIHLDVMEQIVPTEKDYKQRMINHYIPCIVQLVLNLANEELWKVVNFQLLQKTRSDLAEVRYTLKDN